MVRHNRRSTICRFTFLPALSPRHTNPSAVVQFIGAFELGSEALSDSGMCVCISYCSSKWRCLCGAQAMQTTLRLQTNREARSIENLRGFDHVVCHAAHTPSHLYLCKHRYFLVSTAISRLLFAPPNCESAGISCVLCVVWPCGAR